MDKSNETKNNSEDTLNVMLESRGPIIAWIIAVYIGSIIIESLSAIRMIPILFFTGILLLHISLHWHWNSLIEKRHWIYFFFQGILITAAAFLMPVGYPLLLIFLYPVLIGQCIGVYHKKISIFIVALYYFFLYSCITVWMANVKQTVSLLPFLILMTVVVVTVANLMLRQFHARIRTQTFLSDLESAHRKVEELTLANERQRMARDLHDTLAQGLAGLIMQLEAIDAHLSNQNSKRAHEIVLQSMDRARSTLSEARHAIDNLRTKSVMNINLVEAVRNETERFTQATGIAVLLKMDLRDDFSRLLTEHLLHIVRECLTNVDRHAQAHQVWLTMSKIEERLMIIIKDDGKGLDANLIGKHSGHYGLLGIQERIRIIGGTWMITSNVPKGTIIQIEAPMTKGEQ
jgi:NarL family two-component system sensor histidine kinase YdfH